MVSDRIEEYRLHKGYKVVELATIIGISHGSLSDIKNGKTEPRADTLEKICRNTDINAHWLLTGEGPMLRTEEPEAIPAAEMVGAANQPVMEAFVEIMNSDDDDAKGSLSRNVFTFQRTVRNEKKIVAMEKKIDMLEGAIALINRRLERDEETDFKTGRKAARGVQGAGKENGR